MQPRRVCGSADRRQLLTREHERARTVRAPDGGGPRRRRLGTVRRPPHVQVRHEPERRKLLDRLMRGTVLPEEDAVVREDEDGAQLGERREADGRTHVIREDEEGRSVRDVTAVERDPIHDGAHSVLAHAEVERPSGIIDRRLDLERLPPDAPSLIDVGDRRGTEVGRAPHQPGDGARRCLDHLPRPRTRRERGLGVHGRDEPRLEILGKLDPRA